MIDGWLRSYSILFYSSHRGFGFLMFIASFFNIWGAVWGLSGALLSLGMAKLAKYPEADIRTGVYSFNGLLLGFSIGGLFQPGLPLGLIFFAFLLFAFLLYALLGGILYKYGLPVMGLPFLICYWMMMLAFGQMPSLHADENNIYWLNYLFNIGGSEALEWQTYLDGIKAEGFIAGFFYTLSSIFFCNKILAGILVAVGMLWYSRIAFMMAFISYSIAYLLFGMFGIDTALLTTYFMGFNFVALGIALSTYYFVPSVGSMVLAVLGVLIMIPLTFALGAAMHVFNLKALSLPLVVTIFPILYLFKHQYYRKYLASVYWQYNSPEKNLYRAEIYKNRLKNSHFWHIALPIMGEWQVSQGHNGNITHLGRWSKAFDFIVLDADNQSYKHPGFTLSDYYCYSKPVLAPAAGFIEEVVDFVDDNLIGDVNTKQNWGNSIVIRHATGLYSQLSHLKPGSIKVSKGDYVKLGEIIALCGSSGRSPEPHLHFQMQTYPLVGAETFDYPFAYYMERRGQNIELRSFDRPKEGALVSNVEGTPLMTEALYLIPGQKLSWNIESNSMPHKAENWEVFTNAYNKTYLHCKETNAVLYFINDGTMFYTTEYIGNQNSLLFYFYLAFYKVLQGYYPRLELTDEFPLDTFTHWAIQPLNDFLAPFIKFTRAHYQLNYTFIDSVFTPNQIQLEAKIKLYVFKKAIKQTQINIKIAKENKMTLQFDGTTATTI